MTKMHIDQDIDQVFHTHPITQLLDLSTLDLLILLCNLQ